MKQEGEQGDDGQERGLEETSGDETRGEEVRGDERRQGDKVTKHVQWMAVAKTLTIGEQSDERARQRGVGHLTRQRPFGRRRPGWPLDHATP